MARTQTIGGDGTLFVGEDKTLKIVLSPAPGEITVPSMASWTILFDVRKKDNSSDPAIFSKQATVTGTYDPDPAVNQEFAFVTLSDTEMNTVKARTYRHSWKRMDDTFETVLARGDFAPEKATAP